DFVGNQLLIPGSQDILIREYPNCRGVTFLFFKGTAELTCHGIKESHTVIEGGEDRFSIRAERHGREVTSYVGLPLFLKRSRVKGYHFTRDATYNQHLAMRGVGHRRR